MIKIIKRRTFLGMKEQIGMLTKQILKQQGELNQLKNDNRDIGNLLSRQEELIESKNKEIKNLKSLCTKNKVDYKSLYKKEK